MYLILVSVSNNCYNCHLYLMSAICSNECHVYLMNNTIFSTSTNMMLIWNQIDYHSISLYWILVYQSLLNTQSISLYSTIGFYHSLFYYWISFSIEHYQSPSGPLFEPLRKRGVLFFRFGLNAIRDRLRIRQEWIEWRRNELNETWNTRHE